MDSHLAWTTLVEAYEPTDTSSKLKTIEEFNTTMYIPGQDVDLWISKMQYLRKRLHKDYKLEIEDLKKNEETTQLLLT